jgi:hypothetical protein
MDCAGFSVKEPALITGGANGEEETYTSASLIPRQRRTFTGNFRVDFRGIGQRADTEGLYVSTWQLINSALTH